MSFSRGWGQRVLWPSLMRVIGLAGRNLIELATVLVIIAGLPMLWDTGTWSHGEQVLSMMISALYLTILVAFNRVREKQESLGNKLEDVLLASKRRTRVDMDDFIQEASRKDWWSIRTRY